jgi:hypothetical protein
MAVIYHYVMPAARDGNLLIAKSPGPRHSGVAAGDGSTAQSVSEPADRKTGTQPISINGQAIYKPI